MKKGYVGTYSGSGSEGIYQFLIDESVGELSQVSLFAEIKNSKYISLTDTYLYSVYDDEGGSGVAVFTLDGLLVDKIVYERTTSCFLLVRDSYIYTANYHLGTITKLRFDKKLSVEGTYLIREKAGCHQVIAQEDKLFVPCLYLDTIYVFNEELEKINEIPFPKGSGCRHGVVASDNRYMYVIGELSNKVYAVNLATNMIENEVSVLPNGEVNKEGSAAIRLSEDGTTICVSTRDVNIVTVLEIKGNEMKVQAIFSTQGDHPRDMLNVFDDSYLLVANRLSNNICSFAIGDENKLVSEVEIPEGVCVVVEN